MSFVLSFFPRDVLDEILNLIESVSEDFPSYFSNGKTNIISNKNKTISKLKIVIVKIKKKRYIYYLRTTRSKHETEI